MARVFAIAVVSLGVTLTVGGLLSFIFGGAVQKGSLWVELGPFSGTWYPGHYCFLGAILSAVGAGMITAGLLGRRRAQS